MTNSPTLTGKPDAGPDTAQAELLDVHAVSALCHCSARHIYRLADAGRMPKALKLGSLTRWRRDEVLSWISGGCKSVRRPKGGAI